MGSFKGSPSFNFENFKTIYNAVGGERIAFYIIVQFYYQIDFSDQEFAEFIIMLESAYNRYTIRHPSIDDDFSSFILNGLSIGLQKAKDTETMIPLILIIKSISPNIYKVIYEVIVQKDPDLAARLQNSLTSPELNQAPKQTENLEVEEEKDNEENQTQEPQESEEEVQ